jgi:hypothetical protein
MIRRRLDRTLRIEPSLEAQVGAQPELVERLAPHRHHGATRWLQGILVDLEHLATRGHEQVEAGALDASLEHPQSSRQVRPAPVLHLQQVGPQGRRDAVDDLGIRSVGCGLEAGIGTVVRRSDRASNLVSGGRRHRELEGRRRLRSEFEAQVVAIQAARLLLGGAGNRYRRPALEGSSVAGGAGRSDLLRLPHERAAREERVLAAARSTYGAPLQGRDEDLVRVYGDRIAVEGTHREVMVELPGQLDLHREHSAAFKGQLIVPEHEGRVVRPGAVPDREQVALDPGRRRREPAHGDLAHGRSRQRRLAVSGRVPSLRSRVSGRILRSVVSHGLFDGPSATASSVHLVRPCATAARASTATRQTDDDDQQQGQHSSPTRRGGERVGMQLDRGATHRRLYRPAFRSET